MQLKSMRVGRAAYTTRSRRGREKPSPASNRIDSWLVEAALAAAIARAGDPNVAIVPEGPYVVPVVG
jgi:hypothetical protein